MRRLCSFAALVTTTLVPLATAVAQQGTQAIDTAYTRQIRELTPVDARYKFTTELVDYLPASSTVPTPLKVLGYVPGTVGKLTHVEDINRYFRALAAASTQRTKLFSLGMSEEGREELVLAIADEATLARLDDYKAMLKRLAEPRGLAAAERARLIKEAKPIYWILGSIHSPETGSPEMLMELAYRLAVDDGDVARGIRSNVITLITPVQEVDGRDRMVDVYNQAQAMKLGQAGMSLPYWGKYTAHDNNRDGMVASQQITQNYLKGFLDWRPTVAHDLHESVPFLYISTGTGPYNDEIDAITVHEWYTLAFNEMTELTRRGLPGVWTHAFYDGWGANYMMSIVQFHNSLGRFYETYTSSGAGCTNVNLPATQLTKEWYRPNPPVNGVRWCIRSNLNYQQSAVMFALKYVGENRSTFLDNFTAKGERILRRGLTTAPYAFVIPRAQKRSAQAAELVNLIRRMASEVQVATADFSVRSMPRPVEDRGPNPPGTSAVTAGAAGPGTRGAGDSAAAGGRGHPGRAAASPGWSTSKRATGSSAWTSRTRSTSAPSSRRSATSPRTRSRTTTPAGRSTSCSTSRRTRSPTRASHAADAAADGRRGRRRDGGGRRRHAHRSAPRRLALGGAAVEGRIERAGRRHRVHRERHVVPRRHVHRRRGQGTRRRAGARTHRGRRRAGPERRDAHRVAAADRVLPQLAGDAERRVGALRARQDGRAVHVHGRPEAPHPGAARPLRRRALSACRPGRDGARERSADGRSGDSVARLEAHAAPRQVGRDRRHAAGDGARGSRGAAPLRRARRLAARRGRDVAPADRARLHERRDRSAAEDVRRERNDRPRAARDDGESDPLWLRRPTLLPGLLQSDAAAASRRWRRRRRRRRRAGGRRHGDRERAAPRPAARRAPFPRPCGLDRRLGHAEQSRRAPRQGRHRRRAGRQRPRRVVRDPPALATGDAGHVRPRAQRASRTGITSRPRSRPSPPRRPDGGAGRPIDGGTSSG